MKNAPLKGADEIENIRWNGVLILLCRGFMSVGYVLQGILYCFLYELFDLSEVVCSFDFVDKSDFDRVLFCPFRKIFEEVPDFSVNLIIQVKS